MKVRLYIKPEIDILKMDYAERILDGNTWDHGDANEGNFFAEEDYDDDEYDPFFDE